MMQKDKKKKKITLPSSLSLIVLLSECAVLFGACNTKLTALEVCSKGSRWGRAGRGRMGGLSLLFSSPVAVPEFHFTLKEEKWAVA